MKTSARNQFQGKVTRIERGAVNDEVELTVAGGGSVVAIVTRGSCESLGLAAGQPAAAIFKASSVVIGVQA